MSLIFLALAVFFIGSHPGSYAADAKADAKKDVAPITQCFKAADEAMKKSNWDEAIKSFEQAISLDPKDAMAHVGLGNVYVQKGDNDKAIEAYNKAISLDPKCVFAYCGLVNIYCSKGDKDAALKQYKILSGLDKKAAEKLDKRIQSLNSPQPNNPKSK
jgi:tetratricopeptide (TPR) repeat protein